VGEKNAIGAGLATQSSLTGATTLAIFGHSRHEVAPTRGFSLLAAAARTAVATIALA
jgi:hypothetical protein